MNINKILKSIDIFKKLDNNAISELSQKAIHRTLDAKMILFNEGFEGSYFYILLIGSMRIFKTSYDGKESTIKIIHPGEIFAEAVLFGKTHYPASAIATEASEILAINRDSFWRMLDHVEARNVFLGAVFDKLRYLTEEIHYLSSHDVEDRFFRFLINNYGKKHSYDISIPKKDIASAIGTIPETFSRLILRLTKIGMIEWEKNILTVKDGFWENNFSDNIISSFGSNITY